MHAAQKMQEKKEEEESVLKRRANAFYSDLFGRSAAYDNQEAMLSARRGKNRTSHEEHLIVHQDWSDCRTELLPGARKGQDATPQVRRSEELHQARIFGEENGSWKSPSKLEAVSHDNSEKIKYSDGMSTRQLQQGHLKATLQSDDFYKNASNIKEWEVIELHVSGLPHDADDVPTPFRRYCHSPKCQGIAWRTASLHLRTAQLHDEERRVHETKVDKTWLVDTQFLHVSLTFATPGFSNFSFPGKCKSNPRNNVFGRLASVSLQTHVNLMQWISEAFPLGPNGSVRPSLAPFAS
ncbi:unnamed protein product [Durusdinium trenchii]